MPERKWTQKFASFGEYREESIKFGSRPTLVVVRREAYSQRLHLKNQ